MKIREPHSLLDNRQNWRYFRRT